MVDPDVSADEPTNHLDIDMVRWLEEQIKDFKGAVLFISHDRAFIRHLATRIIDLDRGQYTATRDYDRYLQKKQEARVEAAQNAEFDKKLAAEEVWIDRALKPAVPVMKDGCGRYRICVSNVSNDANCKASKLAG